MAIGLGLCSGHFGFLRLGQRDYRITEAVCHWNHLRLGFRLPLNRHLCPQFRNVWHCTGFPGYAWHPEQSLYHWCLWSNLRQRTT